MSNYKNKDKEKATRKAHRLANREKLSAQRKVRYARNKAAIQAKSLAYYWAHREQSKARNKKYYAAHAHQLKAYSKARLASLPKGHRRDEKTAAARVWRTIPSNRSKSNAWTKAWRLRHPQKQIDKVHRRRARIVGTQVERVNLKQILVDSQGLCGICGHSFDLFGIHFDHIIPLAKGGTHTTDNIQATHARCNQLKSDKVA